MPSGAIDVELLEATGRSERNAALLMLEQFPGDGQPSLGRKLAN